MRSYSAQCNSYLNEDVVSCIISNLVYKNHKTNLNLNIEIQCKNTTTVPCIDQALVWPSGHMSLATGYQVLMFQVITSINASVENRI